MHEKDIKMQLWAAFLVILSGSLYGFIGYLGTQILNDHFSVPDMLFWRFFVAFIWMALFLLVKKEAVPFSKANSSSLLSVFILGSLFYSTSSAFYFIASEQAGTGLAMVIFFSFPIFVVLYAWLANKNRINKFAVASLIAILLGLYLLKGEGDASISVKGILLAITSALLYAFYIISNKKNIQALSANVSTTLICFGNAIIFFIITMIAGTFTIPAHFSTWLCIILLGVFATALPIQLLLMGLKYITSTKASILSVLEPVVTVLVGIALLHEVVTSLQIAGIAIMLLGATLIQFE